MSETTPSLKEEDVSTEETTSLSSEKNDQIINEEKKEKSSGIMKLILLIGKHLNTFSFLIFLIAIIWFFLWPSFTKNTYYSENALSVFIHESEYNQQDATYAINLSKDLEIALNNNKPYNNNNFNNNFNNSTTNIILNYIEQNINFVDEKKRHIFEMERKYLNKIIKVKGENIYLTLRAKRESGKESIILLCPLNKIESISFSLSLLKLLSKQNWLHHDIILVLTDFSGFENYWTGELAFIKSTIIPTGRMREAFLFDFDSFQFDKISLLTEGFNGELPNLDMVNVVTGLLNERHYNLGHVDMVSFFKADPSLLGNNKYLLNDKKFTNELPIFIYLYYEFIQFIRNLILNTFKYELFTKNKLNQSVTLLYHWYNQLISLPTGAHGYFRNQLTHAYTLTDTISSSGSSGSIDSINKKGNRYHNYYILGRVMESAIRCMNNLIEELHQSFFLYYIDSSRTYYGFEHYLPNLLLFLGALLIQFIGNYYIQNDKDRQLMHSILLVGSTFIICSIIYLLPFVLRDLLLQILMKSSIDSTLFIIIWITMISCIIISLYLIIYPLLDKIYNQLTTNKNEYTYLDWRTCKAITISIVGLTTGAIMIYSKNILLEQVPRFLNCIDLQNNLFYISFCFVMLPTWLIFIKMTLNSLQKRIK
ncbi:hypothetical protein ABK040_005665 [Willaertia magna]